MQSQVSKRIHLNWQKKCRLTMEVMDISTPTQIK